MQLLPTYVPLVYEWRIDSVAPVATLDIPGVVAVDNVLWLNAAGVITANIRVPFAGGGTAIVACDLSRNGGPWQQVRRHVCTCKGDSHVTVC